MYVNPNLMLLGNQKISLENAGDKYKEDSLDNTEQFGMNQGQVHMYQPDISGSNAIDYAFKKDSIFCIKAFVDSLLILSNEGES